MIQGYPVITLCGSTKFKDEFMRIQKELTLEGYIVISVGCFGHSGDVFTDDQKIMLDDMHKRKIDMADGIMVINPGGYIGSSTRSEIEYAQGTGKYVKFSCTVPGWFEEKGGKTNAVTKHHSPFRYRPFTSCQDSQGIPLCG